MIYSNFAPISYLQIDIIAEHGGDDDVSLAAIDNIGFDAPLCLDMGTTGVPLSADGRTGEHIDKPTDLRCNQAFGKCRWGNSKTETEGTTWQMHKAADIDAGKWNKAVGNGATKPGIIQITSWNSQTVILKLFFSFSGLEFKNLGNTVWLSTFTYVVPCTFRKLIFLTKYSY